MIIKLQSKDIEITGTVLKKLNRYVQGIGDNESGGILLGGYNPIENKYVITDISEPCNEDSYGSNYFVRNKEHAQCVINKAWEESDGKINYLGEWHTHSCETPYPSYTDKKLLEQIIKDKSNVWNEIFMLILGRNKTFYLGMAKSKARGKIVSEIIVKGE